VSVFSGTGLSFKLPSLVAVNVEPLCGHHVMAALALTRCDVLFLFQVREMLEESRKDRMEKELGQSDSNS